MKTMYRQIFWGRPVRDIYSYWGLLKGRGQLASHVWWMSRGLERMRFWRGGRLSWSWNNGLGVIGIWDYALCRVGGVVDRDQGLGQSCGAECSHDAVQERGISFRS